MIYVKVVNFVLFAEPSPYNIYIIYLLLNFNLSFIKEKSKGKQQEHEVTQIPAEFNGMNNILEICNWLVKHPSILQLANQMYMAFSSPIENVYTFNESSMPSSAILARMVNNRVRFMI